jgi:signal transduction histidine kinase
MTVADHPDTRPRIVRRPCVADTEISAADEVRRRIERDLHDGAQQRFVALALHLRIARRHVADGSEAATALDRAIEELGAGLAELRSLARGVHPAILTDHGLEPAVAALAQRTPLPVACTVDVPGRLAPAIEAAAYFVVSEAVTNAVRHADARLVEIALELDGNRLVIEVRDDGDGGADLRAGTGLRGLADRVRALDGHLRVADAAGGGTLLRARIPVG